RRSAAFTKRHRYRRCLYESAVGGQQAAGADEITAGCRLPTGHCRTTGAPMEATLEAVKRAGRGKNEANRLRATGHIPAVVYGSRAEGKAPEGVPVSVDPKQVLRILHSDSGANTLITLKVEGTAEARVMVKEYQLDPITHQL